MKTRTERTLFFDFLPVDLGEMGGFKTRFLLYTVPGQVYYNATRKLVLRGVDAIIFVADSARGKMDENLESLQNLQDNLREYGLDVEEIPLVLQYNKRDVEDPYTVEELEQALNPRGLPYFEAVATTGQGVFETFRGISRVLLQKLSKEVRLGETRVTDSKPTVRADAPAPARPEVATPSPMAGRLASASEPLRVEDAAPKPVPEQELEPVAYESTPALPVEEPMAPVAAQAEPEQGAAPFEAEAAPSGPEEVAPSEPETPALEPMAAAVEAPGMSAREADAAQAEAVASLHARRQDAAFKAVEPSVAVAKPPLARRPRLTEVETTVMAPSRAAKQERPGFWSRLMGRKAEPPKPAPVSGVQVETPAVEIPVVGGAGSFAPVTIERRIQVPITLGPEEVMRGARLRLVLEIKVEVAGESNSKVA